jgi:hypothetical protein
MGGNGVKGPLPGRRYQREAAETVWLPRQPAPEDRIRLRYFVSGGQPWSSLFPSYLHIHGWVVSERAMKRLATAWPLAEREGRPGGIIHQPIEAGKRG